MNKQDKYWVIGGYVLIVLILLFAARADIFFKPKATPIVPVMINLSDYHNGRNGTNPSARVHIQFYSDYECEHTGAMYYKVKRLMEEYGDDLNVMFRHYPLTTIHNFAYKAAEAAECARDQGKFLEYNDKLYMNQLELDRESLINYADSLDLDVEQFTSCLDNGEKVEVIEWDQQEAVLNGVAGTPTFLINGKLMEGTQHYETMKEVIDENLG